MCISKDVNYDFNIKENTDVLVFLHVTAQANFPGGKRAPEYSPGVNIRFLIRKLPHCYNIKTTGYKSGDQKRTSVTKSVIVSVAA